MQYSRHDVTWSEAKNAADGNHGTRITEFEVNAIVIYRQYFLLSPSFFFFSNICGRPVFKGAKKDVININSVAMISLCLCRAFKNVRIIIIILFLFFVALCPKFLLHIILLDTFMPVRRNSIFGNVALDKFRLQLFSNY